MISIEENILSGALQYEDYLTQIVGLLKPEHFESVNHQKIYQAILDVFATSQKVDLIGVSRKLRENKINLDIEMTGIISRNYPTNIQKNCLTLIENFVKKQLNHLALKMINSVKEPGLDPFLYIGQIEQELSDIIKDIIKTDLKPIGELRDGIVHEIAEVITKGVKPGLKCGIEAMNRQTNGWQNGNLIILAGRPGMGKSSAALDFCLTPALNGTPTAFFSLEMTATELAGRVISIITYLDVQNIINKNITKDDLAYIIKNTGQLDKAPLYIDTKTPLTLSELRNKARKIKREKDIKLIVVDYLQLITTTIRGTREQEISELSRGLKLLAKEMDIPIIVLSQLSRKCEERADKKPILSDLRESGAIEQDADLVIFCFRPEYYEIPQYFSDDETLPTKDLFVFNIAKFRNGKTGDVIARWVGEQTKITNYNSLPQEPNNKIEEAVIVKEEPKQLLQNNTDFLNESTDDLPY